MAFKRQNLTPIANNGKAGVVPALWLFWNEDGDVVTVAGYIKEQGMSYRDQVMVVSGTNGVNNKMYHVSAKAATGVITLTASTNT